MSKVKNRVFIILSAFLLVIGITGCKSGQITNEDSPLVFGTQELDEVFNPFFATTGPDMNIVGMTQISMLSTDKDANIAFGADQPVVTLDLFQETKGAYPNQITEYTFVLKNNLKFSDGKPLTLKDVLFNMYVYLDPLYSGSTTMYSTDIVGLKAYRTLTANSGEQDGFELEMLQRAKDRVDILLDAYARVKRDHSNIVTDAILLNDLATIASTEDQYVNVLNDYKLVKKLFREELNKDFTDNMGTYDSYVYSNGKPALANDVETFLHLCGFIDIDAKKNEKTYLLFDANKTKKMKKAEVIEAVYNAKMPGSFDEVVRYWATADNLVEELKQEIKTKYFKENPDRGEFKNIQGIVPLREGVTINNTTYAAPVYDASGNVISGNEALKITINNVDPKAIWNFGFQVAPMHYYSTKELCDKFDFESNFGVEYGSIEFMNNVLKSPSKVGLPVGAGAYKATNRQTDSSKVNSSNFFADNVVYFEANEHFIMGKPIIRKLRYKVIASNYIVTALDKGEIHFGEPSAKPEIKAQLNRISKIGSEGVMTAGYGYIGINAAFVEDVEVRRAIMHAMDTTLVKNYYDDCTLIYRPMTRASWAYPENVTEPFYEYDETGQKSEDLVIGAGYSPNSKGIYTKNGKSLKFRFTVAGETTDHPAYQTMANAARILNARGWDIMVVNDPRALSKLSTGDLQVWAAAWGSTIDPDMYQVYHMNSSATSVKNWGYNKILRDTDKFSTEYEYILTLSELIDQGRQTLDQEKRTTIYHEALDVIMEMAVELPTYQRTDLFAFNKDYIDTSSFTPTVELSAYNGLINQIWLLSLNETIKK